MDLKEPQDLKVFKVLKAAKDSKGNKV
jgi:hypothetical protein